MDLERIARTLPANVSLVVVETSDKGPVIFEEEERLVAGSSPVRASEFRLGRRAAHLALEQIGYEPVPILRGSAGEPVWPPGVVGSITHDGTRALAAAAPMSASGGIGIDLEDRSRYFDGLETEIAGPGEMQALDGLDGEERMTAAIEIFSAKESIYKAHYPRVGRFFGFDSARIEFSDDHLVGYLTQTLVSRYPTDRPMRIDRIWEGDTLFTWLVLAPD